MKKVSKCRFFILCVFILISGSLIVASLLIERNNSENNRAISQVLVKISNTDTEAEKIINEKMHNNEILSYAKIEGENIYSLELKTDELNNLRKDNNIERVEDDTSIHILNTINNKEDFYSNPTVEKDSQLSGSTKYNAEGATISWNIQRIKADQLHKDNIKGYGIKVAVFDTGIDLNNDDINVSGGISFIEGITSYDDDNGHGTAMAGILAAQLNGYGLVGVAPDVELYSVKVLDRNGIGKYSNIIQGINWAIDHDIDIITLSLGGSQYSQLLYDAIEKASENNILIVAAAGNDGNENILYPAAYPQVICVGASDYNDNLAEFSNYGERLDIAAPGVDVVTTGIHNTMITLNGTSSAAQHVAGAAALLWSVNKDLSYITIKDLLCRNSSPLEKYVSDNFHYGLVNIEASYYKLIKSDYIDVIPDINILNQAEKYTNTGDNGDVHALACTHSWNKTSSTAAKCTSAGSQSYICKLCGATKTESIAALGHIMGTVNTATCTSAGNIIVKCTRSGCSYVQGTQPSSALGHNIYTTTSSTHVSGSGHLVTKTCSRCGKVTGSYYSDCATLENDSTHTNGKGHYWRIYDTICGITYSSGYTYNMTYFKDPSHVNGLGHYWTRYCAICGGESTSGYDNSTYISCDTSSNGHTSSGHLQNVYCSTCNTVLSSNYLSSYTTTTGSHTAYGHYVQKKCDYCGIIANSYYTTISTCLSCTTAPSVSFNNVTGDTILTEANTAFQLQIKVQDNENDTLTCNYYMDGSTTSSGSATANNTSTQTVVSFANTINAANLSEGTHTIKTTVKDSIAPTGEASVTFKVDKSAPVISTVTVDPTTSGVKLTVNASDSISGLSAEAYRYTLTGISPTTWLSTNSNTFTNLTTNTSYNYTVEVMDKVGHIATYSGTFSTKVDTPVVTATALSENKIQLLIKDSNPTTTNYRIQIGSGYATTTGTVISTENWLALSYDAASGGKLLVISGLSSNTVYGITASSRNSSTGALSTGTSVSVLTSPASPANLTCTGKSYNYIKLGWNGVAGATSYQLYRETLANDGTVLAIKQFTETTLLYSEDSDVLANQNYRYKIRAKNTNGIFGCWSDNVIVKTLPTPPVKVTGVTADSDGKVLAIKWDVITGVIGYKVNISYDGNTVVKSTTTNQISFDTGLYNCQCNISIQAFNVYEGNDVSDSTKWSNGGEKSESIICYTEANTPIMNPIQQGKITPNSISVQWQTNGNPASVKYVLDVILHGTLVKELTYNSISADSYESTITGLEPETTYSFKVKTVNSTGIVTDWSNEVNATTLMNYPDIPGRLRATAKADKIILSWDVADKAQGYQIERNGTVIAENFTGISYVDEGLSPESEYTYRIKAVNTTGCSDWSQPLKKMTLGNLLSSPVISSVTGSSISLVIEWSAVDGASGYDLEADGKIYNVGLDTSFEHNGLLPGSYHNYRIRTRNIYGKGDWSGIITAQTVPVAPEVPGNITITSSDKQILISWSMVQGAASYDVEIDGIVYTNVSALQYLYTVPGDNISGTKHSVRVRAVNNGGLGEWSEGYSAILSAEGEESVPMDPVPTPPSVVCSVSGSSIIAVSWDEVEGATVYKLEADNTVIYTGPDTNYIHIGLAENSQHQYRVSAGNLNGFSDWSSPVIALTSAINSATPSNITYYRESDSSMSITWDNVNGVDGYRIEVNGIVEDDILQNVKTTITTIPGNQYNIRIASVIRSGEEEQLDWSDEITFRTPDKLPSAPTINDLSVGSDTVKITLGTTTDATGYELELDGQMIDIRNIPSYIITGLEPSSTHKLRLRAYNEAGTSDWCEAVTILTNEGIPGVPTNIIWKPVADISAVTGSAISLSWNGPEGTVSYEVEDENGKIYTTDSDEVVIKGLVSGEQYNFRVRALTEAGAGAWSSRITVTPVITMPINVTVVADSGIVRISWDKVGGTELYEIELDGITVATSEGTSIDFGYETFYKHRTIRVRACSGNQKSEWSQKIIFNQSLPITAELNIGDEISVILPVSNADINNSKLIITYNSNEMVLLDAFGITPGAETNSTYISEYNTHVIIEQKDKTGTITFIIQSDENTIWSGIASIIKFKSLITGKVTIYYEVTEK